MSYHQAPSQRPSLGSKQGIGGFRDSMGSGDRSHTQGSSPGKANRLKRRSWLYTFLFRRKKHRKEGDEKKEGQSVWGERQSCPLKLIDEEIIEMLTLLAQIAAKGALEKRIEEKLVGSLSLPVHTAILSHCDPQDRPYSLAKGKRERPLDQRVFHQVKQCLHSVSEAKQLLKRSRLRVSDQLLIVKKMVACVLELSLKGCLDLLIVEFFLMFDGLYLEAKESIIDAFFSHHKKKSWSKSLNGAMAKSENPFKLAEFFHQSTKEKKGDFSTQEAIEREIEQLERDNPKALLHIQRQYYYTTTLPSKFRGQMESFLKEKPKEVLLILEGAVESSY